MQKEDTRIETLVHTINVSFLSFCVLKLLSFPSSASIVRVYFGT